MTEGIFRVPGSAEEVNSFKAKYNLGAHCNTGLSASSLPVALQTLVTRWRQLDSRMVAGEDPKFSESHVHSVASMLKLYFR